MQRDIKANLLSQAIESTLLKWKPQQAEGLPKTEDDKDDLDSQVIMYFDGI